jgi:hypothetical protein
VSDFLDTLFSFNTIKFLDFTDILIFALIDKTQTKSIKYKKKQPAGQQNNDIILLAYSNIDLLLLFWQTKETVTN